MEFNRVLNLKLIKHGSKNGFSLVELLIVMVMFIVVIMISASAFEKILGTASQQTKSSESNIQGVVGLEIMRSDLEHAGYGLSWCQAFVADFSESGATANFLANGIDPAFFNDTNNPTKNETYVQRSNMTKGYLQGPRAVQSSTASGSANAWENDRDYLVIKSTILGMNDVSKKWSYLDNVGGAWTIKQWGSDDFVAGERVITLDSEDHRLIDSSGAFSYSLTGTPPVPNASYQPESAEQSYLLYGVNQSNNLSFPYNRVDYYINRPNTGIPERCASGTGILYKANVIHSGTTNTGGVIQYPLLECVADMQVVYALDTTNSGGVNLHSDHTILQNLTAEQIRTQLKEIKVYILTHEGGKDKSFTYPNQTVQVGDPGQGRAFDLATLDTIGTDWNKYRWKVYTIVARPKNLNK
jgi:type II secretory pathway pseudopilin PulG